MVNDKHLLFFFHFFFDMFLQFRKQNFDWFLTDFFFWVHNFDIIYLNSEFTFHFCFVFFTTDLKNKNLSQYRLFLSKFEDYILQYLWLLSQNSKFLTELQEKSQNCEI